MANNCLDDADLNISAESRGCYNWWTFYKLLLLTRCCCWGQASASWNIARPVANSFRRIENRTSSADESVQISWNRKIRNL